MSGYQNPIIPGFHPDPSICRVGDEYFLVTSTFTYFPGVPIFRSRDLVHWTQIGNVLDRPTQLDLSATVSWASNGVFAPTIRHHDSRFWMITTMSTGRSLATFYVTAEDPAGPWTEPTAVDVIGIDPDLAWGDDGTCYVHTSIGTEIARYTIDDLTGAVLEPLATTWSGTGLQYPEAPHLFRRGDRWYLLIAEGGTERGHSVSIARGPTPTGPWEGCPHNPIMSHRSTDWPIQNTGHADLVEFADGTWWMVLLGVRPRGMTPGYHTLGRETFLTPIEWLDGWPVVAPLRLHMENAPPSMERTDLGWGVRDDFDGHALAPEWVSVRGPLEATVSLTERPGSLTLHGGDADLDSLQPTFLGRRQQLLNCRIRTLVDVDDVIDPNVEAGLAVRMDEHSHYDVFRRGAEIAVRARIGPLSEVVATAQLPTGPVVLRIETRLGFLGPDVVVLGYEGDDGTFHELTELDGRYLATESAGGFIGRVVGLYATRGTAAFDWYETTALERSP
jgi:beta-xylosidase